MPTTPAKSPPRISIRRKVLLGFGVVLLMLGAIAFIAWRSTASFEENAAQVTRSRERLELGEQLMRRIMEKESARRGLLLAGSETARAASERAAAELQMAIDTLQTAVASNPVQAMRLNRLKELLARMDAVEKAEQEALRTGGLAGASGEFRQGNMEPLLAQVRQVVFELEHDERVELAGHSEATVLIGQTANAVTLAGSVLTLIALGSAVFLIVRDIERRHRAETLMAEQANLLSNIMEAMPDHVYVKDARGRYLLHNRAHRLYLGLRANESIVGKSAFDLFPKDLAERYWADDAYVLETGAPIRNREEPARPTSPNIAWLSTTKMPLRDPAGRVIGVVCVSADITARRLADEKLKHFAAQLERSNAELQSFASAASHDLQEPLRKIQAFGDRLKAKCAGELGPQGLEYLERMLNAAGRMQVLIQDLLKLSRVASHAQPFEKCDLGQVVAGVLGDLEVAIEAKGALLEVGPLPAIEADPVQMRQLFQNLIANALKFQKPGQAPVVKISARIFTAQGDEPIGAPRGSELCELAIEDNGIGFEQKFAEQIFVVFQRLHTRESYEGTGIGLAVCRKITDRHKGTIVAKGCAGQGACFLITLPLRQTQPSAHE